MISRALKPDYTVRNPKRRVRQTYKIKSGIAVFIMTPTKLPIITVGSMIIARP